MDQNLKEHLISAADRYETTDFISCDPVRYPHRYTGRQDIEISAFISAWMAYGSRKVFLRILEQLHKEMDATGGPYSYITSGGYSLTCSGPDRCLYRFYRLSDFRQLCGRLTELYSDYQSLEDIFHAEADLAENVRSLCSFFKGINGIPVPGSPSANKRLYMFLRWMVRRNSPVDFGIWSRISPRSLLVPLDTHVYTTAVRLGITTRKNADLKTAVEITSAMSGIWPDDPARGDFALYGMGIDSDRPQTLPDCE